MKEVTTKPKLRCKQLDREERITNTKPKLALRNEYFEQLKQRIQSQSGYGTGERKKEE